MAGELWTLKGCLGIQMRGGTFTISKVKEVVGGCLPAPNSKAPLRLINMYTQVVKSQRLAVLQQLPLLLMISRPVILVRDFNCIINEDGRSGGPDNQLDAAFRFLMGAVKVAELHVIFSKSKEAEIKRINKELANIRSKFKVSLWITMTASSPSHYEFLSVPEQVFQILTLGRQHSHMDSCCLQHGFHFAATTYGICISSLGTCPMCCQSGRFCSVEVWNMVVGDKTLDGYNKKKYICKLLFIFLLGHDIDFGHMEAVNLLSSNKYTEKQI
eukprot:g43565.t1